MSEECCCGARDVCRDPDGRLPLTHVKYIAECHCDDVIRLLANEVLERREKDGA